MILRRWWHWLSGKHRGTHTVGEWIFGTFAYGAVVVEGPWGERLKLPGSPTKYWCGCGLILIEAQ